MKFSKLSRSTSRIMMSTACTLAIATFASTSATGCKGASDAPASKGAPAPSPSGANAAAAPSAAPTPAPAPAAAASVIDLGPAGGAFVGLVIKGPSGAQVSDNGAGGASVLAGSIGFEINSGAADVALIKDGVKSGLEFSKGKVTYTVDKKDELVYITETPIGDGITQGFGGVYPLKVDGKPFHCRAQVDTEAQLATIKSMCDTLAKK